MKTTSLYSKMHALGMIVLTPLSPLQPLELPTNMNYLLTSMTTHTPQDYSSSGTTYGGFDMPAEEFYQVHTTNLNRPPNVSTLTPRKPIPSPLLADQPPEGLLAPSSFLPTSTNS